MRRRHLLLVAGGIVVAGATAAYAASVGLTSKRLTVLSADAPTTTTSSTTTSTTSTTVPDNAMTITLANGSGATVNKADKGDSVTITFNPAVKPETFCSTWTGTATSFDLGTDNNVVVITIKNGLSGANDTLSVTSNGAGCTFRLGTISLGSASYVSQDVTFKGTSSQDDRSSVVWTPGTKTMVLTLGGPGGAAGDRGTVTAAATTTFTPDSANLRDTNNNAVTGTATTTTKF